MGSNPFEAITAALADFADLIEGITPSEQAKGVNGSGHGSGDGSEPLKPAIGGNVAGTPAVNVHNYIQTEPVKPKFKPKSVGDSDGRGTIGGKSKSKSTPDTNEGEEG